MNFDSEHSYRIPAEGTYTGRGNPRHAGTGTGPGCQPDLPDGCSVSYRQQPINTLQKYRPAWNCNVPAGRFCFELCACPRHDKHGGKVHNIKYQAYPALPAVKPLFDQRRQQQDQCIKTQNGISYWRNCSPTGKRRRYIRLETGSTSVMLKMALFSTCMGSACGG